MGSLVRTDPINCLSMMIFVDEHPSFKTHHNYVETPIYHSCVNFCEITLTALVRRHALRCLIDITLLNIS